MSQFWSTAVLAVIFFGSTLGKVQAASIFHQAVTSTPSDFRAATFEFNRAGLAVPRWTIEVHADGSGVYTGSSASKTATPSEPIHVSAGLQTKLTAAYPVVRAGKCETKMKHIAETGRKTVSYEGGGGSAKATCTFNFSDNDSLNALADAFLAIAQTMQAGERLAQKHRYDRLALDAEIDAFVLEVKAGRASEIENIAPVLQSIAEDDRLMERVQRKAARLLQEAGVPPPAADSAR